MSPAPTGGGILVVCTGNVCRSPFIERLLQAQLPPDVPVSSAGTGALVGSPMDPGTVSQLERLEVPNGAFAARQLTSELVASAELVITATRAHRAAVVRLHPRGMRTAFTLGDLADLTRDVPAPASQARDLARAVEVLGARRGMVPPRPAEEVDIIDPYRREAAVFDAMARQVLDLVPPVVRFLRP